MIRRLFLGLLLLVASTDAQAGMDPVTSEGIPPSAYPAVVQLHCDEGWSGSGVRVGPEYILSVAHVTNLKNCKIGGNPIKVLRTQGDFSLLTDGRTVDAWTRIDCGGFMAGHHYAGVGYARGLPTLTEVDLTATGITVTAVVPAGIPVSSVAILNGVFTVIPGQSGGAVIDTETGRIVGVVDSFNAKSGISGSIELKETSICQRS